MKCICGADARAVKIPVRIHGVEIGTYGGHYCSKCDEKWFNSATVDRVQKKAKRMGLFGLESPGRVGIAGNSLMLRIPKPLAKFLNVKKGTPVRLVPEGKSKLVVEIQKG